MADHVCRAWAEASAGNGHRASRIDGRRRTSGGYADGRLMAIAPFYGAAAKPQEAVRRLCPVVGS